jgi:hypothetical protein
MNSEAWGNIARCANERAQERTFNWDEECNPLGDLQTREMANMMSYRESLLVNLLWDILSDVDADLSELKGEKIKKLQITVVVDE